MSLQRAYGKTDRRENEVEVASRSGGSTHTVDSNVSRLSSFSRAGLETPLAVSWSGGSEFSKVIINGILKEDYESTADNNITFAVLGTILPTFNKENLLERRVLRS